MSRLSFLEFLPHLKALTLSLKFRATSFLHGQHLGIRKGYEDELIEYRNYEKGDDLRYLDWKLYAKTDKYYVRQGYQNSKQKVIIWLDSSSSQRLKREKFNISWLLALSFAYLYLQQHDEVQFYAEDEIQGKLLNPIRGSDDLVMLNEFFVQEQKPGRSISIANSFQELGPELIRANRVVWLTDLYLAIHEYKIALDELTARKVGLILVHLIAKQEAIEPKKGFLNRVVDSETKEWLPSSQMTGYSEVWQKAIEQRIRLLAARNNQYLAANIEEGPIKILSKLKQI